MVESLEETIGFITGIKVNMTELSSGLVLQRLFIRELVADIVAA
jgi:hypothetical protein